MQKELFSRRDFLHQTAALTGAFAMGSSLCAQKSLAASEGISSKQKPNILFPNSHELEGKSFIPPFNRNMRKLRSN